MKILALILSVSIIPIALNETHTIETLDDPIRVISNNAFKSGEYLKYRIHYGIINAGIAELRVNESVSRNGQPVFHMVGTGRSTGMAEWFFRTRDTYQTYMDKDAMVPVEFIRDVDEGGYKINRHLLFDHTSQKAVDIKKSTTESYLFPKYSQDLLSTLYYARCYPVTDLKPGQTIPISMFLDYETYNFELKYLGIENIKSKFGTIRCKKLIPVVQSGRVFEDDESIMLWVSDDENKIPVRLEAQILVGSVKMDLDAYENTKHPLRFK